VKAVGRRWLLRSVPLLALAAALPWALRRTTAATAGSPVPGDPRLPLALPGTDGRPFDIGAERGRVVLVYFGYTHCPDVCPSTLADLRDAVGRLGPDAGRVRVVFVTLDPRRDTGPLLADYLASFAPAAGAPFVGLVPDEAALAAAARAWGVTWRSAESGAYLDHSSVVTAVGPDGRARLRYGFSQSADPAALARDVEGLIHGA
jgi:protein SCO1/2